jgi:hypothetical protein
VTPGKISVVPPHDDHDDSRGWSRWPNRLGSSLSGAWPSAGVIAAFVLCLAIDAGWLPGDPEHAAALRCVLCLCALPAIGAVMLARRLRGRAALVDVVHPLAWIHPAQLGLLYSGHIALALASSATASIVALGLSVGWRCTGRALLEHAQRVLRQDVLGLVLLCVLLWLARMMVPGSIASTELDASWAQALCHLHERGLQPGVDWLFTAGPLGWMHNAAYDRHVFWTIVIVWECGVKLAVAVLLTASMMRLRGVIERGLYFALILLLPVEVDSYAFLAMLSVTVWILDRPTPARPVVVLGLLLLGAFGLAKFTLFIYGLICVVLLALAMWRAGSLRRAVIFLALWAGVELALWFASGQSLSNVRPYLTGSLEVSSGYSEAMSSSFSALDGTLAVIVGIGALLAAIGHALARPRGPARAAGSLALLAAYAIAFKAGYTRGDHPPIFYGFAAAGAFLLGDPEDAHVVARAVLRAGRIVCAAAAVYGLIVAQAIPSVAVRDFVSTSASRATDNVRMLSDLPHWMELEAGVRAQLRSESGSRRVCAAVGNSTIDAFSWEIGLLLLQDLHWKPRMSLQSFSAYTPKLLELNANGLRGAGAPEFVLFKLMSIDERLPTMDDGEALKILARDYRVRFSEDGRLLLHHEPLPGPARAPELLLDRTIRFDESVDISKPAGKCQLLALDIRYTTSGKLREALLSAPAVFLDVTLLTGQHRSYRIVPGMMKSGVVLNPWIRDTTDWAHWVRGDSLPRVKSIRLVPPEYPWMYEPEVRMRLLRADDIQPVIQPELSISGPTPSFSPATVVIESGEAMTAIEVQDRIVTIIRAPLSIQMPASAGHHRLRGRCGLAPKARRTGCAGSVHLRVELVTNDKPLVLLERTLDTRRPADSEGLSFDLEFDSDGRSPLRFSATSQDLDPSCAWTFWERVRLDD